MATPQHARVSLDVASLPKLPEKGSMKPLAQKLTRRTSSQLQGSAAAGWTPSLQLQKFNLVDLHVDRIRNEGDIRILSGQREGDCVCERNKHAHETDRREAHPQHSPEQLRRNVCVDDGREHDQDIQHHCLHGIETNEVVQPLVLHDGEEHQEEEH